MATQMYISKDCVVMKTGIDEVVDRGENVLFSF